MRVIRGESFFSDLAERVFDRGVGADLVTLFFRAEESSFTRFNDGRIRQTGLVDDCDCRITVSGGGRVVEASVSLPSVVEDAARVLHHTIERLRNELPHLLPDPLYTPPEPVTSVTRGESVGEDYSSMIQFVAERGAGAGLTGLLTCGPREQALLSSNGARHFFSYDSWMLDFSLYHASGKAVKTTISGEQRLVGVFESVLESAQERLRLLDKRIIEKPRGRYRVYLEPSAVGELLGMLRWQAFGEESLQSRRSPLSRMREEGISLSPLLSIAEDYRTGRVPRFDAAGDVATDRLVLLESGQLVASLVSKRSEREFGVPANGSLRSECLNSVEVGAGSLRADEVLQALGTGLYLPNLHYLNWSDRRGGRLTGMTRFSPFWVEDGVMVGPIRDLRFDDTLYRILGDALEAVTEFRRFEPVTWTYGSRMLGGMLVPGMVIDGMEFTL